VRVAITTAMWKYT